MRTLEHALTAQCEVHWKTAVETVDTGVDAVRIGLRTNGTLREISARLVVGADGLRSRVRDIAGIPVHRREYGQTAIVANLSVEHSVPETAFERFSASGPLALLPIAADRHVAIRCCAEEELEAVCGLSDPEFLAQFEAGFGHRFGELSALGKRTSHPLILASAERIVGPRIALVGAAANSIHPNAAQGLNLGLRDVEGLAACLDETRRNGGEIGGEAMLGDYARRRRADQRSVVRFTDTLAQLFSRRFAPIALMRDAAMFAIDVTPPAKRWLIRRAAGLLAASA
jgi:2-octaprenyl-6-methoxyphenol hydroxylase